jgi:hypothetical protein
MTTSRLYSMFVDVEAVPLLWDPFVIWEGHEKMNSGRLA